MPTQRLRMCGSCPRPVVRSARSLPIRTPIARAGRRMGRVLRLSRINTAAHKFGSLVLTVRREQSRVSPDGKWVIFSVVDVSLEANTKTPHVWIVPTAGGQEREIIADQDADRQ